MYVCQQHSGAYSKFGQYLSTLVKIIPDEYTLVLKALQDAQPGVPLKDVRRVIQEDFGMPLTSLYASFDPKPIAAASLAQVHRAVTIDGQTVAVKVQYPRLAQQTKMDMTTLQFLAVAVGVLFKDYEYGWLFPEFAESMQLELDFLQVRFLSCPLPLPLSCSLLWCRTTLKSPLLYSLVPFTRKLPMQKGLRRFLPRINGSISQQFDGICQRRGY